MLSALVLLALAAAPPADPQAGAPTQPPAPEAGPPLLPLPSRSACAPEKMVRLVVRNISPGLSAGDPRAQPRMMYRRGSQYLRTEEQPDPSRNGAKPLFIVAEPDVWVLDASTRSGRHTTDPGPDFDVHAPILPQAPDLPPAFRTLEFGCEPAFVAANAPQVQRSVPWGEATAGLHVVAQGPHTLAMLMDNRTAAPLMISYLRAGKPVWVVRYDEFRADLPDRPELFQPSRSFRIEEAPRAAPGGQPPPPGGPAPFATPTQPAPPAAARPVSY